ncbi:BamA/TamA family outer membrane protein [Neolewinella lacunae]|uniref:BamA/TamA family outer membrane protein n=1 Tax=Neolewinella lacunae TaxID=1517758 RepID=A0A923T9E5_9BACT|nr:BamA/TamA family outer membrane protein [Neolewinella lacunae]MBC6994978.1 BamA/TamA family outer membrane protein [Neolewinella lacunae]MDN3633251.1 BamA/TamA family outer membrane protein [Neolewinella lacunae]
MHLRLSATALCFFLSFQITVAQGLIEKVTDLMEFNIGRPPVDTNDFQTRIVLAPIAYFEPNTSLGFGFGANLLFKPKGAGKDTRTSNIPIGVSYTLKNQVFFTSGYTVFFPEEKWLLRGNLDYTDFPQNYFGVGNGTTEADRSAITYQRLLIEPLLLRQVLPKLFVGGGFRYNTYYNTALVEATEALPAGASLQDSLGSKNVGLEFAASYDNRDNVLNAQKGILVEFTQGFYGTALGGTSAFELSKLDLRAYRRTGPRGVLGFQLFGRYGGGETPVQELSFLGGPELLRGFPEFRFRDRLAVFAQAEYRWQTWKSIGFVFYGGAGQVAPEVAELAVPELRYSLGTGLRVTIIPKENINLRVDYAFGLGKSNGSGFYLGLGEAF